MLFDDDARLTKEVRAQMQGCPVVKPVKGEGGAQVVSPEFTVDVPAPAKGK